MSQENVELVERAVAAINARDIDAYLACCTEDIELWTPVSAVSGVYEGRDGIERFFADIEDAGPDFRIDIERVEAIGGDRVLFFTRVTSTGRASGLPTAVDAANIYELDAGKIRRLRVFLDHQAALEAVGLRE
jgi:ketosteroid isomerase-like protein